MIFGLQYLMDKKKELEELAEKLGPEAITRPEHWLFFLIITIAYSP